MAFNCFSTCLADFLDFQMLSLGSHLISLEFLFDFLRFQSTSLSFNLLVDHNEGSGKTLLMLLTLRNFYSDSRPKIIIFKNFPKDTVCNNFYCSCLEWPSRWQDYFAAGLHSLHFLLFSEGCLWPSTDLLRFSIG